APIVSAIIPARNEALNIGGMVWSLAAQPDILEIIVVNDDSKDDTGAVLAGLQSAIPALRVLNLSVLPAGWLGKQHAAAEGAREARGDWLLFTDADTEHLPGSLRVLLDRAEREGADLLSISPGQRSPTWWEKAVIPLVYVQLAGLYRFDDVSDPASPAAAANGQYMLIRRRAYWLAGGHQAVREEVLDDVALARRVKAAGGRILFLPGADWVQTRMYRTFGEMWRGWTKNLFLLYGRSTWRIGNTVLILFAEWASMPLVLVFILMPLLHRDSLWLEAGGLATAAFMTWRLLAYNANLTRLGFSKSLQKYFWLGAPIFCLMLLNSVRAYKLGGAVEWKGRTYSVKGVL
ncbi:MAG: glycosyltransferase, partial [Terriglobia bacterium]